MQKLLARFLFHTVRVLQNFASVRGLAASKLALGLVPGLVPGLVSGLVPSLVSGLVLSLVLSGCSATFPKDPAAKAIEQMSAAAKPLGSTIAAPRNYTADWMSLAEWYEHHASDVRAAESGEASIVFLGDSITQGWPDEILVDAFKSHKIANFGIGGDLTQNLIWRLQNGARGTLKPKVVVQLIGVNNMYDDPSAPGFVFAGVKAATEEAQKAFPDARFLVIGVLPADTKNVPDPALLAELNQKIEAMCETSSRLHYTSHADIFLKDGSINTELMPDKLHPNREGYQRWITVLKPEVEALLVDE